MIKLLLLYKDKWKGFETSLILIWLSIFLKYILLIIAHAFVDHPKRTTTTIKLVLDNGQFFYHPSNIKQAYINEDPRLSFHIHDDSSQSIHSMEFDGFNGLDP